MSESQNESLQFKDFDYELLKKQLPQGYEPIPYISVPTHIRRYPLISINGFSTFEDANDFVSRHQIFSQNKKLLIEKSYKNAIEYEYKVIAPYALFFFIDQRYQQNATITFKSTPHNDVQMPPILYRNIGSSHIEPFFEKGELQLSTFKRCRTLENDNRRDIYELRNIIEIHEENKTMNIDIGFDDSLLVLCTTLPPIEDIDPSATIKITNATEFYKEITKTLIGMGYSVAEVLYGPCVYNDKVISINTDSFISSFEASLQSTNSFPSLDLSNYINSQAENDIIMNKPYKFRHEQEFRFVWKLCAPLKDERLLIINPNLANYCEKMDYKTTLPNPL